MGMTPHDKKRALIDTIAAEAKAHNIGKIGAFGMGIDPVALIVGKINGIPPEEIQATLESARDITRDIGAKLQTLIDA